MKSRRDKIEAFWGYCSPDFTDYRTLQDNWFHQSGIRIAGWRNRGFARRFRDRRSVDLDIHRRIGSRSDTVTRFVLQYPRFCSSAWSRGSRKARNSSHRREIGSVPPRESDDSWRKRKMCRLEWITVVLNTIQTNLADVRSELEIARICPSVKEFLQDKKIRKGVILGLVVSAWVRNHFLSIIYSFSATNVRDSSNRLFRHNADRRQRSIAWYSSEIQYRTCVRRSAQIICILPSG